MKILVISDSHGNLKSLEHVLDFAQRANLEAIIHCGDWGTPEAAQVVASSGLPLYAVLGNADVDPAIASTLSRACFSLPLEIKGSKIFFKPVFLKFEAGGQDMGVSHFPKDLKSALESGEYDILFHGHTHRKKDEMHGATRVVNPGALSRTGSPSFAVYDTKNNSVEFVDLAI